MNKKKALCLLMIVLMLIGMSCICNVFQMLLTEKEDELTPLESEGHNDLGEAEPLNPVADEEEIDEPVTATVTVPPEEHEDQQANPLQHAGDDSEEEDSGELYQEEMGTQPNWSIAVTGCEEYFEEGEDSGFYPSVDREEIEFVGEFHKIILTMTKNWRDETMWFVDYTDGDVTNDLIDLVIYDYTNDTYVFLPDWLTFYWEYDEDQQHIFGIIDFDARAFDSVQNTERSPECVITGQFAFDNIPID